MENGSKSLTKKHKKIKYISNQFIETELDGSELTGDCQNSFQVINEPISYKISNRVCYILIQQLERSYLLQSDLCLNIQLVPFSFRWILSSDGYRCKPGEAISVSTCFGHRTLLRIVEHSSLNFKKISKSQAAEVERMVEQDKCESFIDAYRNDLEQGEIALLRVEVMHEVISQYKLIMEYVKISSRYNAKASFNRISLTGVKQVDFNSLFVDDDCNYTSLSSKMDQIYDTVQLKLNDILLVSGAGNSGKTSLVHHLINRYVSDSNKFNTIYYLECDPGQTEFTPCGILSLVKIQFKVSNALASKFWFHARKRLTEVGHIVSKVFGTITPSENADEYFDLIRQLFGFYRSLRSEGEPLIINTMGWIEGLGIDLLAQTILLTQPTNVIHIKDSVNDDTLIQLLDLSHSTYHKFSYFYRIYKLQQQVGFRLWSTSLGILDHCKSVPFKASIMRREIQQLSYIIANLWPNISCVPFYAIKPTRFSLNELYVYVVNCPPIHSSAIYDLLNATWVFLAHIDPKNTRHPSSEQSWDIQLLDQLPSSATCLGCAVVRSVDPVDKCLYLVAPSQLELVNLIVLPDLIAIPPGLMVEQFMYQDSSWLPYIELLAK